MKIYIFYFLLFFVLVSCKKPEACINASPTTVKVGQNITFVDCSADAKTVKIDFGDGSKKLNMTSTKIYAYGNPGNYTAKIECYSKNENRKLDETSTIITVQTPTEAELIGTWRLYEEKDVVFGINTSFPRTEDWIFDIAGMSNINGSIYNWSLGSNNLSVSYDIYRIVKLYNGDLVLRFNEFSFFRDSYTEYYFSKQ